MPEPTNDDRVARALTAIRAFNDGDDEQTAMRDLLSDLMHLSDASGWDFSDELRIAHDNYEAEIVPTFTNKKPVVWEADVETARVACATCGYLLEVGSLATIDTDGRVYCNIGCYQDHH